MAIAVCATSCKNDKQAAQAAEAGDAVDVTEAPAPAEPETQEVSEEEMESQGGMYNPRDIARAWKRRVINVPGQGSDIVALFEAFYTEWPTVEGNRIVHMTNPQLAPESDLYEEGSDIDRKNGYVESVWYEGEPLGTISACVWKRKDGHKLFAVNFNVPMSQGKPFLCFYDFDPDRRTLTPENSPIKQEQLNFPDQDPLWYQLPKEGKTLEVVEKADEECVATTFYEFDGQNLKLARRQQSF